MPSQARLDSLKLAVLLPAINLSVHLAGTRRTRRWLLATCRAPHAKGSKGQQTARGEQLAQLAARIGRHGRHQTSCLRQALATEFLLRRERLPARFCIGTTHAAGNRLQAHAWVELHGRALAQQDNRFQPLRDAAHHLR